MSQLSSLQKNILHNLHKVAALMSGADIIYLTKYQKICMPDV